MMSLKQCNRNKNLHKGCVLFFNILMILSILILIRSNTLFVSAEEFKQNPDLKIDYGLAGNSVETYNNKNLDVNFTLTFSNTVPSSYYPTAYFYRTKPQLQDDKLTLSNKIENYCSINFNKINDTQFSGRFYINDPNAINIEEPTDIFVMIGKPDWSNPDNEIFYYCSSSENELKDPAILTIKINKSLSAEVTKTLPSLVKMDSWFAKIKFSKNEPLTLNGEKFHQIVFVYRETAGYDDLVDAVVSEGQTFNNPIENKAMKVLTEEDSGVEDGSTWYEFKKNFSVPYQPNELKLKVGLISEKYLVENKFTNRNNDRYAIILNNNDKNNYFWGGSVDVNPENEETNIILKKEIEWRVNVFPECLSRFIVVDRPSDKLEITGPNDMTKSPLVYKVKAIQESDYSESISFNFDSEYASSLGWNPPQGPQYPHYTLGSGSFNIVDELTPATEITISDLENDEITVEKGKTFEFHPTLIPAETTDNLSYSIKDYSRDNPTTQIIKPKNDSPSPSENMFIFEAKKYGDQEILIKANEGVTKTVKVHVRYRLQSNIQKDKDEPTDSGGQVKIKDTTEQQVKNFNNFVNNEEVTLQAIPDEGYRFVAWQINNIGNSVGMLYTGYEFMDGTDRFSTTVKLKMLESLSVSPIFTKNPIIVSGAENSTVVFIESNGKLITDKAVCEIKLGDQFSDKEISHYDVVLVDKNNNILSYYSSLRSEITKVSDDKIALNLALSEIDETISYPLKAYVYYQDLDNEPWWGGDSLESYFKEINDIPTVTVDYQKNITEDIEEFKIVDKGFNEEAEQGDDQSLTNMVDGSSKTLSHSTEEDFISEVEITDVPNDFCPIALITKNDQPVTGAEFKGTKVTEAAGLKILSSEGTSDWKMTLKIPRQNDKDVVKVQYGLVNSESLSEGDNLANPESSVSNKLIISNADYQIEFKGSSPSEDQPGDNPNPNPDPNPDPKPEPVPGTNPGSGSSSNPGSGGNSAPNTPIVTGVSITGPDRIEMVQGDSKRLTATLAPQGVTGKITWTSSNSKVVTVDSQGCVKAVGEGISVITAQCGSFRDTIEVTVIKKEASDKVTGIAIKGDSVIKMKQNETRKLTVNLEPASSSGTVNWTSSNNSVATVDRNGSVTAKGVGNCTITAECDGHKAVIQVIVEEESRLVYRLYNEESGEHLFTSDLNEYNTLPNMGWTQEGTGWTAPDSGTPVYRLYNPALADHLYTSDLNEVKVLSTERGWQVDNNNQPLFYSGGNRPIYRLYHEGTLRHLLTKDRNEYKVLGENGWSQEGQKLSALR